jgi:signal transduction histidine kinase
VTEFSYKNKNDHIFSLEATATNMLSNPSIGGIVLNIRDITLRKRTEMLKETEKLLEEEKIKTEFISNATHEIRTPLAIIRGNVDLAMMKGAGENKFIKDRFKAISHEIEHLSYMLSDLNLLTSDKEKIKDRLVLKETDVSKIIKHIVGVLKVVAYKKSITIKIKTNPKIILLGDGAYLEKMLANLIKNAITYGKEKGWISIESARKGNMVEIKISDNGIGMAKEDLPNIFDRFYKADKSHGLSSKRFGLGLAIVKWVVSAHKGTINVESQLGEGSTFVILLPTLN